MSFIYDFVAREPQLTLCDRIWQLWMHIIEIDPWLPACFNLVIIDLFELGFIILEYMVLCNKNIERNNTIRSDLMIMSC